MNNIGKMDRRIIIQKRIQTKDDAGGIIESWLDVCHSWAEKIQEKGSASERGNESEIADADRAENKVSWRTRYKATFQGLSAASGFRVVYKNEVFNILHSKEEGRKDALVFTTLTTEGIA